MLKIPYTKKKEKKIPFAQEELKMYTCKTSLGKQQTLRDVTTGDDMMASRKTAVL